MGRRERGRRGSVLLGEADEQDVRGIHRQGQEEACLLFMGKRGNEPGGRRGRKAAAAAAGVVVVPEG